MRARERGKERDEIPALEWATAIVGAALLVAALAFLLREALAPEQPGPVTFSVTSVRALGSGYLVEFQAHNAGDTTYAELEVEGTLRGAGREERAEATLDYLPARSTRAGGLFFGADPARGELRLAAKGFREP